MEIDVSALAELLECVNVTTAALPKIKIGPFDNCPGCELVMDDCLKEHLGREFQQLPVCGVGDHRVDTQFGE